MEQKRIRTKTRDFGVSKRESHDSSRFYASKLYEGLYSDNNKKIIDDSTKIETNFFQRVHNYSDSSFNVLPYHSIHLAILIIPQITPDQLSQLDVFLPGETTE